MEEWWNKGQELFVFSLDIRQAFDPVDQQALIESLKFMNVPNFLINRIIKLGLYERTPLRCCNRQTPKVQKRKGVKQGCPLSPRLFTIALHHILCRLKERFPSISLGQNEGMSPPVILAYADDILLICRSMEQLQEIMAVLKELLAEAGLIVHPGKSELIVRDPQSTKVAVDSSFTIAAMDVKAQSSMKYLGTYLTATLNRPENVKKRCMQGTKASKMILPFLLKNKPPWYIVRRIYSTVIVPTIVFGLNAMALTAYNRSTLRRYERKIVQEWYKASGGKEEQSARKLLSDRTIGKKVKIYRILYWGHITRREGNHLLQAAFNLRLPGPKRFCRPCDTWFVTLEKKLQSLGKTKADFEGILYDRNTLKKEVAKLYSIDEESDSEVSIVSSNSSEDSNGSDDEWMNIGNESD